MKRLKIGIIVCLCIVFMGGCSSSKSEEKVKIGIVQISEHESLNIIREAYIEEFESLGYNEDNSEIIYQNANGDMTNLKTIMEQMAADDVDIIVPISTPCAQVAAPYADDIPVVFAAVSDPVAAGLMDDLEHPNNNITGVSNEIQVDQILDAGMTLYPEMKTLGLLYSSGEVNAVSSIEKAKSYAKEHNLEIVEVAINNTADIQSAVQTLNEQVDAIFIPNDNTIINAMDIVTPLTREAKIPTFCGVDTFVKSGGLLNVGIDYVEIGKEAAQMSKKILDGTPVEELPVKVFKENLNLYVNETTAKELGITFDSLADSYPVVTFE